MLPRSIVWEEFTTPEGLKIYCNMVTRQAEWTIPDEQKLARGQIKRAYAKPLDNVSSLSSSAALPTEKTSSDLVGSSVPSAETERTTIPAPLATTTTGANAKEEAKNTIFTFPESSNVNVNSTWEEAKMLFANVKRYDCLKNQETKDAFKKFKSVKKKQDADIKQKKTQKEFTKMLGESEELNSYSLWSEAIDLFKDDPRYCAIEQPAVREDLFRTFIVDLQKAVMGMNIGKTLRSPGNVKEETHTFFEEGKKKQEDEEMLIKQKKAQEEFIKMLEESEELTIYTVWSEAINLFKDDARFCAIEQPAVREDLFRTFIVDLQKDYSRMRFQSFVNAQLDKLNNINWTKDGTLLRSCLFDPLDGDLIQAAVYIGQELSSIYFTKLLTFRHTGVLSVLFAGNYKSCGWIFYEKPAQSLKQYVKSLYDQSKCKSIEKFINDIKIIFRKIFVTLFEAHKCGLMPLEMNWNSIYLLNHQSISCDAKFGVMVPSELMKFNEVLVKASAIFNQILHFLEAKKLDDKILSELQLFLNIAGSKQMSEYVQRKILHSLLFVTSFIQIRGFSVGLGDF